MLGRLVRWLRILGFDAIWASDFRKNPSEDIDSEILAFSLLNNRVLVTRDKQLAKKADSCGLKVILIPQNSDIVENLVLIFKEMRIKLSSDRFFPARCPVCNGTLQLINKLEIKDRVPLNSWRAHNDFWICNKCGKVYWKGSHWKNIVNTLNRIKNLLEKSSQKD